MNILITIHHDLDLNSGAPGSTLQLAQNYRDLGHHVEVVSFDDLPRLPEQAHMLIFPFFVAARLKARAVRGRIDVIDAHTGDSWIWSTFLRRRAPRTVLVTRSSGLEHTGHVERIEEQRNGQLKLSRLYFLYHGGFRLWEVAHSLRKSDLCILLNEQDRQYTVETLGVPASKTRISANGIPDSYTDLPLEIGGQSEKTPRLAIIGTYSERKGIAHSVPALQKLLDIYPDFEIGFFGAGCEPERVTNDFTPAVRARIRVVPRYAHDELPALLRGFEMQLLASLSEGFAKALVEGMACGLAAVTTDVPGSLVIARDGENAIVVPRRNSEAIFTALKRLIDEPALREKLRRAAHQTAQNYTWRAMAKQRLGFYEEARKQRLQKIG